MIQTNATTSANHIGARRNPFLRSYQIAFRIEIIADISDSLTGCVIFGRRPKPIGIDTDPDTAIAERRLHFGDRSGHHFGITAIKQQCRCPASLLKYCGGTHAFA